MNTMLFSVRDLSITPSLKAKQKGKYRRVEERERNDLESRWPLTFVYVGKRAKGKSYKKAIWEAFCIPGYYQPLVKLHTWQ